MNPVKRAYWIMAVGLAVAVLGWTAWQASSRVKVRLVQQYVPEPASTNPIIEAMDQGLSDAAFEDIVRTNRAWLSIPSKYKRDVLTETALLMKTNYARILIRNGASLAAASNSLTEVGVQQSLEFLARLADEAKTQP